MCSGGGDEQLRSTGFPIRKSPDQSLVADSPGLIAGSYVLHRLLVPRHPPCALNNLATTDDARVHYAVLKIRAVPAPRPSRTPARALAGFQRQQCTTEAVRRGVGPVQGRTSSVRSLRTQQRARPGRPRGWRSSCKQVYLPALADDPAE